MAICRSCGIAYMDGESHQCEGAPANPWALGGLVAVGIFVGGLCGSVLLTVACVMLSGSNLGGLIGIFVGVPAGAVIGGLVAANSVKRRGL